MESYWKEALRESKKVKKQIIPVIDTSYVCENDKNIAICSGCKFAGDYGQATGPFTLCFDCLKEYVEFDGSPFGKIEVYSKEKFLKAIWDD